VPLELVSFVKGLTFSFQSLAEQKIAELSFESTSDQLNILSDKDKLEKVVSNLLSNAFKFTPENGRVTVSLKVNLEDHTYRLSVSDSGCGIAPDQLNKIFDRFYQADNAFLQQEVGSGIGLSLSKELVELMGGSITAESRVGQGSVFSFSLPYTLAESSVIVSHTQHIPKAEEAEMALLTTDANEVKEELVLIIEDNPDVRQFIRQSVAPHYRILEAENGRLGVEMAQQEVPDLIISDVMMPEMDGYQACRLIKEDEKTSHIPVILLTAKAGMEHKLEGLETGADDYLAKPFHTKELLSRIRNLIRTRQKLKQKYLAQILDHKPAQPQNKEDAFLKKMREAVEARLDEETFSIEDLSREVGMSRTQVHRKLKALTSQSASQFMRSIRLQHGMKLLKETNLTVSEIAYQVGFSSVSYFTKCFGDEFGSKPTDVRELKMS
ncbi:MAG: ATP-binding protein, partial [Cyclobacteriaceae bacterium]